MSFNLPLPAAWRSRRWKVKIRDEERLEPPHVSIIRGTRTWRLCLRTDQFLDDEPDPREVPGELLEEIRAHWELLRQQWDETYPENPISSSESDDE
jgi:hypothetical protein